MRYTVKIVRAVDHTSLEPAGPGLDTLLVPLAYPADRHVASARNDADKLAYWLVRAYEAGREAKAAEIRAALGVK